MMIETIIKKVVNFFSDGLKQLVIHNKFCLNVGEGIKEAIKQAKVPRFYGGPDLANKIMIVFTDGWSNKGPDPEQQSQAAIAAGFAIFSVSVVVRRRKVEEIKEMKKRKSLQVSTTFCVF